MKTRSYLGLALILVFVIGAGYIIKANQPATKNAEEYSQISEASNQEANTEDQASTDSQADKASTAQSEAVTDTNSNESDALTFSMADVESRASEEECWTAIDGEVYDLSTWISRHPGGPAKIIGLCGIDASTQFEQMHGRSNAAKKALALLKIGTLN